MIINSANCCLCSPYFPALAEARDIVLFINPLQRHFALLEEIDFAECKPLMIPMMHVVCMLWANSRYYCHSSKITVLFKQICNLVIQQVIFRQLRHIRWTKIDISFQAKRFLDPSSIFHTDIDEAMQRLTLSIHSLKYFRSVFDYFKENLAQFFHDENHPPVHWTFHPNAVFERFNAFMERLNTIQW